MGDVEEKREFSPNPGVGENKLAWARALAASRAWVVHAPSRMVSRVKSFYDGIGEVYVSTSNGKPVKGPVLELEDGNTFVAPTEELFVELTPQEADYHALAQTEVAQAAKRVAEAGASRAIRKETALLLLGAALRSTARVTDAVSRTPPRPPPPQGAPPALRPTRP